MSELKSQDAIESDNILQVRNLAVEFHTETGRTKALQGVSFDVPRGQVTAIIGESGSGKSVTASAIMRLIQPPGRVTAGSIDFAPSGSEPYDVLALVDKDSRLEQLRGDHISMVFQEPMTALAPVYTVGNQVAEAILCHREVSKKVAWDEAANMLQRVGIDDLQRRMQQYPFEFSGGMRQRVVIAMALVCQPDLLICDEPTTALDVTIQAEILTLIRQLKGELNNSVLFITHDIGVVAQLADHVVVMQGGRVLEAGTVRQVLKQPMHPYSKGLMAAIPGLAPKGQRLATVASVVGATDITTAYPLTRLADGRQISLSPSQLKAFGHE
ncbi:MAG: dipeptide ABC transporter ATP-binding protein DppD [Gammaproteobacteria bacterium]|nr:dipeptide ABC transporter ATP-binding protein DppD [Gammaproteobacteria bacterium]